jgi:hypothetical protein
MNHGRILFVLTIVAFVASTRTATAQDELTGMFRLTRTTPAIVGQPTAEALSSVIPPNEELQWQVFVPEAYNRQKPPGIFVYIDPNGWGGIPDQWRATFEQQNMIWIGARQTGNNPSEAKLAWTAILAYRAIEQDYRVDLRRLYVGSSGDTAVHALNAMLAANEFTGAVYISGSMHWGTLDEEKLENLRRKRHVFITGSNDKAKSQVRKDYERYQNDGIENARLIFVERGPGETPNAEFVDEAIRYLDTR